jgi:hypothetical protein
MRVISFSEGSLAHVRNEGQPQGWIARHIIAPKDHMSEAVFYAVSINISGLVHIGVPTMAPDVAHFESAG